MLVILIILYFALPTVGIRMSGFVCAWLGLSLVLAAMFFSSIYGTFRDSFEQLPPTDLPRIDEIA